MEEKINYFIEQTNERLDKIDHSIRDLLIFKWQLIGAATFVSVIVSLVVAFITR